MKEVCGYPEKSVWLYYNGIVNFLINWTLRVLNSWENTSTILYVLLLGVFE